MFCDYYPIANRGEPIDRLGLVAEFYSIKIFLQKSRENFLLNSWQLTGFRLRFQPVGLPGRGRLTTRLPCLILN
jgi:hypothetical protein